MNDNIVTKDQTIETLCSSVVELGQHKDTVNHMLIEHIDKPDYKDHYLEIKMTGFDDDMFASQYSHTLKIDDNDVAKTILEFVNKIITEKYADTQKKLYSALGGDAPWEKPNP